VACDERLGASIAEAALLEDETGLRLVVSID